MAGSTVATVPGRVRLDGSQPIADFLSGIQTQASGMIPYEQFGLRRISKIGPDAKAACELI